MANPRPPVPPYHVWLFADSTGRLFTQPKSLLEDYTALRYRYDPEKPRPKARSGGGRGPKRKERRR